MAEPVADYVVTSLSRVFADDVAVPCTRCDRPTYVRPHTMELALPSVCVQCWSRLRKPGDELVVTRESLREVFLHALATGRPH